MLKALLSLRLRMLLGVLTGAGRSKKAQSAGKMIGFAFLMLYAAGSLGFLFWHLFETIAFAFHAAGVDWLYFAMEALFGFGLMFIGSVFTAKAQLYEARDNDLLLSLPIRPGYILLSRMFLLWVIALALELLVAIPAGLVWRGEVGFSGPGHAAYLLIFVLLLPLLALSVSALFGWLLHLATARVGKQSLVTVVLSLLFLGVYMVFMTRLNSMIEELAMQADAAAAALGGVAPLYWIGAAAARDDTGALLRVTAGILLLFVLVCWLLARTFLKTATDKRGVAKKKYVERETEALSPRRALLRREWQRFAASPAYILNSGLGAIMAPIGGVALLIKRQALMALPMYEQLAPTLQLLILLGLCFCAGTILLTAPSISLEGRTLWLLRSLPVESAEVLRVKLLLHLLVGLPPVLLASVAAALALEVRGALLPLMCLTPAAFCVFAGVLGLAENLRHPYFDWVNETQAVKSGASILLTMFICWGVLLLPVLLFAFLGNRISGPVLAGAMLAVLLVASALLYRWIMSRGLRRFERL